MKEKYFEALKEFGSLMLAGFDLDFEKSTLGLNKTNDFLKENPKVIALISDPENLELLKKAGEIIEGKGGMIQKVTKIIPLINKIKKTV